MFCAVFVLAAHLRADAPESLSPSAAVEAPAPRPLRPILSSTLRQIGDYGLSPLGWRTPDLLWIAPAAAATGLLLANDVPLYAALAKDDSRKDWLDTTMPVVSNFGEGGTLAALAALGAWFGGPRMRRTSTTALQGLAVTGVYAAGLKYAAWANRPSQDDQAHRFLAYDQSSLGMPSGHSFSSFCVAEVYGAEYGRGWTYPLAALVAYSRIYNQAHWPSDVLVGSVLGVAAGGLAVRQTKEQGPAQWRWGLRPGLDGPLAVAETSF